MIKRLNNFLCILTFSMLYAEVTLAQAPIETPSPQKPLMSLADVQKLINQPMVLATRLIPNSNVSFYRAKSEQIGGPNWEPAVTFWTKPIPTIPHKLGHDLSLCSSQSLTVPLWRRSEYGLQNVYGVVNKAKTKRKQDPCASADPEQFFSAANKEIAAGAIAALRDLLSISPLEEVERVNESCDSNVRDRFCGLWAGSLTEIYEVERTDCTDIFYRDESGTTKEHKVREGNLTANDCYRLYEGNVYSTRKVVIEIGPAKPKAYIEQAHSVI